MPPRDPSLPEGTDHIIDTNAGPESGSSGAGSSGTMTGAAATGGSTSPPAGSAGATGGTGTTDTASSGTGGGSSEGRGSTGGGNDTGGGSGGGGGAFNFDKSGSGDGGTGKIADQITSGLKDQFSTLKGQAGERARGFADTGKSQATDFLKSVAGLIDDAARSVEERMGDQYAGYGHRASSSVASLASTLDERTVDELIDDARAFVRRSPAVAIGIAAVVGFAVARLVRTGIEDVTGNSNGAGRTGGGNGAGKTGSGGNEGGSGRAGA